MQLDFVLSTNTFLSNERIPRVHSTRAYRHEIFYAARKRAGFCRNIRERNAEKINFFLHKQNVEVKLLLSHQTLFIQQKTKKKKEKKGKTTSRFTKYLTRLNTLANDRRKLYGFISLIIIRAVGA